MHFLQNKGLRAKRHRVIAIALICLVVLAYIDWFTGPNVSVTCFYLILVFYLSWYGGWRLGVIVAALHAVTWIVLDYEGAARFSPLVFWNFLVRFVTFVGVVWLVQLCKNLTGEVERLLTERTVSLTREVDARAASEEAIRKLANQLSEAEDVERRRLGQELHDSLGQSLTLLKLRLESMAAGLPAGQGAAVQDSVALLSTIIGQARTLTFELYPTMLDQLGLTTALSHYATQLSAQIGAAVRVSDSGPEVALPLPVAGFLFRAVKELINNALKHGAAREIVVQIRRRHENLRIVVSDDGTGFDSQQAANPGLGLAWIRERLLSLGGTVELDSAIGDGTRVSMDLPAPSPAELFMETTPHGQPVAR